MLYVINTANMFCKQLLSYDLDRCLSLSRVRLIEVNEVYLSEAAHIDLALNYSEGFASADQRRSQMAVDVQGLPVIFADAVREFCQQRAGRHILTFLAAGRYYLLKDVDKILLDKLQPGIGDVMRKFLGNDGACCMACIDDTDAVFHTAPVDDLLNLSGYLMKRRPSTGGTQLDYFP